MAALFPARPSVNGHDESPFIGAHAPACLLWAPPLWFRGSRFLLSRGNSGSFVKHLGGQGGQAPWGTPKITPQQDGASPQCEDCSSAFVWEEIFTLLLFFQCVWKPPAYLHPDSDEQPCWPDLRLSTPLIHKHRRDCNLVPPKTFQGRLGGHKTAE